MMNQSYSELFITKNFDEKLIALEVWDTQKVLIYAHSKLFRTILSDIHTADLFSTLFG